MDAMDAMDATNPAEPARPSEADIASAYQWATRYAAGSVPKKDGELSDAVLDTATDGVLWAIANYNPIKAGAGGFQAFAESAVKRCVQRAIGAYRKRERPVMLSLSGSEEDDADRFEPAGDAAEQPLMIADLPEELAFTVRLIMVDGYSLEDAGKLTGVSKNTVSARLRQAAELLAPGRIPPIRKAGERRLSH